MSYFEFPHTRTYDSDLGWLIKRIVDMQQSLDNFINFNTIKYADPINWNITSQYEGNTVVINAADGTAYISTKPVPSGVSITNTDYWTPIFNYGASTDLLREQIAAANEKDSATASRAYEAGELVWLNGILHEFIADTPAATPFLENINVREITVEEFVKLWVAALRGEISDSEGRMDDKIDEVEQRLSEADSALQDEITAIKETVITPEMYGAAGDGVTDDTAAILSAITDGRPVKMTQTYKITEPIHSSTDCEISGGGTILEESIFPMLIFSECTPRISDINFRGVTPPNTNPGSHLVEFVKCSDGCIEECTFQDVGAEAAIYLEQSDNIHVSRNRIKNFSFIGILVYFECNDCIVDGNTIEDCVNTSSGYGIQNNVPGAGGVYAKNLIISNNLIRNVPCWDGIMSHGGENITIIGNTCYNCRTGIDCSAKWVNDGNSVQKNYIIANNNLYGGTSPSIPASNINMGIIFGYDNNAMSESATISGNTIANFNDGTGGNTGGIRIANATDVIIQGNTCQNVKNAMVLASSVTGVRRVTVSGNIFDVTLRGINMGAGVFIDMIFISNVFCGRRAAATPSAFIAASGTRLVRCFEKSNTFDRVYEYIPSSGARCTFHTERDVGVNATQQNSAYKDGDIIWTDNAIPEDFIGWVATNTGIYAPNAWSANTAYALGAVVNNGAGGAYMVTKAGSTGSSAPTHTDGEESNGSTIMMYLGADTLEWKTFGAITA